MNKQLDRPAIALPRPGEHYWRACAAKVRSFVTGEAADALAQDMYPDDAVTPMLLRASSSPAKLTVPTWAGSLGRYAVNQAVQDSVSMSAVGRLILAGGLHIDLGRLASVVIPARSSTPADAGQWVAEGAPIPVRQFDLTSPSLRPHKLAVITSFSRELSEASNVEDVIKALITEAVGPAVDGGRVYFGSRDGSCYCVDRQTGKLRLYARKENQMLVLNQFATLPVLLFTSRYQELRFGDIKHQPAANVPVVAVDKRTGKMLLDMNRPDLPPFYALDVSPDGRRVTFTSPALRVRLRAEDAGPKIRK